MIPLVVVLMKTRSPRQWGIPLKCFLLSILLRRVLTRKVVTIGKQFMLHLAGWKMYGTYLHIHQWHQGKRNLVAYQLWIFQPLASRSNQIISRFIKFFTFISEHWMLKWLWYPSTDRYLLLHAQQVLSIIQQLVTLHDEITVPDLHLFFCIPEVNKIGGKTVRIMLRSTPIS
jgi:hypothetical protein